MKSDGLTRRLLAVLGVMAVTLVLYLLWARPYQLRWGATDEEVKRSMPGDGSNTNPSFLATRAISIDGAPEEIWPWLMQMGYTRAGFYGFDLFANMGSPRGPQGVDRILTQYQDFAVGDEIPISPTTMMHFEAVEPYAYIVWSEKASNASLTWGLYPIDGSQTRLVSRTRWNHHWTQPGALALDLLAEFTDHLAMRKVLQGVKGRVEGKIQPASDVNIELFIYVGSPLVFAWAALSVLRLPLTRGSWLVGLCGGLAWLITWYAPDALWIGAALSLLIVWAVRVEFRDHHRSQLNEDRRVQPHLQGKRT